MIQIDDKVWVIWAMWILLLPLNWLAAVMIAALFHELAHICAVYLLGGFVRRIILTPMGARIETENIFGLYEAICALAGPAANFAMVSMIHKYPIFGLCALVQGLFNLLPVYPLDGGRALRRILEWMLPQEYSRVAELVFVCLVFAACVGSLLMYR